MITSTPNLNKVALFMEPKAGTCISQCNLDAALLACQHEIDVRFTFSSDHYLVKFDQFKDCSEKTGDDMPF